MSRLLPITMILYISFAAQADVAPPLKENAMAFYSWCEARIDSVCPVALVSFRRTLAAYNATDAELPQICLPNEKDDVALAAHIMHRIETEPNLQKLNARAAILHVMEGDYACHVAMSAPTPPATKNRR